MPIRDRVNVLEIVIDVICIGVSEDFDVSEHWYCVVGHGARGGIANDA